MKTILITLLCAMTAVALMARQPAPRPIAITAPPTVAQLKSPPTVAMIKAPPTGNRA